MFHMFNKAIILFLFFGLSFAFPGLLQAEGELTQAVAGEEVEVSLVNPGIQPDSFFYPFKLFFENIRTTFTFGDLAKAERFSNLAERRIAEAKIMMEKGEEKRAENVLNRYQNLLDNSLERSKKAQEAGKDSSAIQEKLAQMTEKHLLVLDKVVDKVPEMAQKAIGISFTRQMVALERLAEINPLRTVQLNQEMLARRITLIREKIADGQEDSAAQKLVEWQQHVDILKNISEQKEELTPVVLRELEKNLGELKKLQEEADAQTLPLGMIIRDIRSQTLEEQLGLLEAFQEKNPSQAAILLDSILDERLTRAIGKVTISEEAVSLDISGLAVLTRLEMRQIGDWLRENNLNQYGDLKGTNYAGGTPLFDEATGETSDRFDYLLEKFPDRPWQEEELKEATEEMLREEENYLNLWQKGLEQIEIQILIPSQPLEEKLEELYNKLPEENQGVIRGVIRNLERVQQRTETRWLEQPTQIQSQSQPGAIEAQGN